MEAQMRALLLATVIISSATEEVTKILTGTVGGQVTLPDSVEDFAFILFNSKNLAMVKDGNVEILERNYENKLLYSKTTGLFTITDLLRDESGSYTIDSKQGKVFTTTYELTVYESVSAPSVSPLSTSSDSCTLLCVVDKAEETTLLWYKDEDIVKQNISALSLSLTVHEEDYNSPHRCVAANPAENKTCSVNVREICEQNFSGWNQQDQQDKRHRLIGTVVPIVSAVIILLAAFIIKQKCLHKDKKTTAATRVPENPETDVAYSDVLFSENRWSQQVGNIPEPTGNLDGTHLKTVYDKLKFHRLASASTDPADNV